MSGKSPQTQASSFGESSRVKQDSVDADPMRGYTGCGKIMGIHYVEKTFEMGAPSGLGAHPRPELIGPLLSGLHATLVDSVRMGFLHASRLRGRIPRGLEAAADVRFLGMDGKGDTVTRLHFQVARFGDVAAELFEQRQLWDDGPQPEQTAFDLLALSLGDVRSERSDSSRFDQGLLDRFAKFGKTLNLGVDSIRIDGATSEQSQIDQQLVQASNDLRKLTPPSRRVRLRAKLDMLGVSRKVMGLYAEDGTLVTALWNADDFAGLANFLDKDVTIEGLAVFRPSGKLLRIDADAISAATAGDSFFSTVPLPGVVDYTASVRSRPGASPYKELLGMIPGEESDADFLKLIESMG